MIYILCTIMIIMKIKKVIKNKILIILTLFILIVLIYEKYYYHNNIIIDIDKVDSIKIIKISNYLNNNIIKLSTMDTITILDKINIEIISNYITKSKRNYFIFLQGGNIFIDYYIDKKIISLNICNYESLGYANKYYYINNDFKKYLIKLLSKK
jgi:hypothetical protein